MADKIDDTTERRARAICKARGLDPEHYTGIVVFPSDETANVPLLSQFEESYHRLEWHNWIDAARAVAESDKAAGLKMIARKPTPKMVEAGTKEIELIMPMISVLAVAWDAAPWLPGEGE